MELQSYFASLATLKGNFNFTTWVEMVGRVPRLEPRLVKSLVGKLSVELEAMVASVRGLIFIRSSSCVEGA